MKNCSESGIRYDRHENDYKKRKENWKETPASYLKHSVHSAKAETRSNRHTVLGMDIAEAEAAALTNRPNKKVDY